MANIAPTLAPSGGGWSGTSVNVTGAAVVGTLTGDWITNLDGMVIDWVAIAYNEDAGAGLTVATLVFDAQIAGDTTNVFRVSQEAGAAVISDYSYAITIDPTSPVTGYIVPFAPRGVTAGGLPGAMGGITAIRAVVAITGTGGTTDAVKVVFGGHRR